MVIDVLRIFNLPPRIGRQKTRVRPERRADGYVPVKFAVDKMLGRLARWLRIIGQDAAYGSHLSGRGLVRAARREDRVILTRDRKIGKMNAPHYVLIESDRFREQLRQVVREFRLDPFKGVFTRCVRCNTPFEALQKETVRDKVPPYVFSTQDRFSFCTSCRRIYWPATHERKMLEELKRMGL